MVSVFAIFATLSMMEMKMMGVGLSAAILIDATVIRLVMLPAILVLLGDRVWWPLESAAVGGRDRGRERAGVRPGRSLTRHAPRGSSDTSFDFPRGVGLPGYFLSMQSDGSGVEAPEVEVRRSRRRTQTVSAYRRDGKVIVMIPDRFTRAEEAEWVTTMLQRLDKSEQRRRRTDEQLMRRARELCRDYLHDKVRPTSVRWVDNMTTRWASCTTSTGEIRLSDRLQTLPAWVVDYVLLHELAHLIEPGPQQAVLALGRQVPSLRACPGLPRRRRPRDRDGPRALRGADPELAQD